MPGPDSMLPEGTDSIIDGAAITTTDDLTGAPSSSTPTHGAGISAGSEYVGTSAQGGSTAQSTKERLAETASGLKGQATDKARAYAVQGKDKATDALENFAQLVQDAAAQVDEKVGPQYGAYARQGADAVASLAGTLRDKDVDELFNDARDLVRKSPAVAIGAAAAIGFLIARVAKAGLAPQEETTATTSDVTPAASETIPPAPTIAV